MPVEIREIVIKTEIKEELKYLPKSTLDQFRMQILEDCKKMIKKEMRAKHNR